MNAYDEYTPYYACDKDGHGWPKGPECQPSEECLKYQDVEEKEEQ